MNFYLTKKITLTFCLFVGLFFPVFILSAYEIREIDTEIKDDFILEPAKLEISLNPGDSTTKTINILNRTDKQLEFKVEVEDFTGSQDPNQTVILKGEERGSYSLKDYLTPEINIFSLKPKQKMILPITVSIPFGTPPGGLYGSVLISSQATLGNEGTGAVIISRLGALFFVNVVGEVTKNGELISFSKVESKDEIGFELLWANTGNVYLNPHGHIRIFNLFGVQVDEIEIPAYFTMPDSVRYREVDWGGDNLFGRYKAEISLNRGYDNLVDELALTFWVLSTKLLFTILGGIILFILAIFLLVKILR